MIGQHHLFDAQFIIIVWFCFVVLPSFVLTLLPL